MIFSERHKNALWLHLSLVPSTAERFRTFRETLLPTRMPAVDAPYIQRTTSSDPRQTYLRRRWNHSVYLARRSHYHLSKIPSTLWHGARWWHALQK